MLSAAWLAHMDFLACAKSTPDAVALTVDDTSYSYGELASAAAAVAERIRAVPVKSGRPAAAIHATRAFETYAAVLGALMAGYTYVPLNPKYPAGRNAVIVERSGASVILAHQSDASMVQTIAETAGTSPTIIHPNADPGRALTAADLAPARHDNPYAYIMFTSGSTGTPKGVPIRHSNLSAYLDAVFQVLDYDRGDRLSQNFDLTFDLSVHDMFVCWRAGACLVVPSLADLESPAGYIRRHRISCWFSVPTLGQKLLLQGALTAGAFPGMRLSLFCGEALPTDLANAWKQATGQRTENWYGPTEATISCMRYPVPDAGMEAGPRTSLVPIGVPLPGTSAIIVSSSLQPVADGEMGELLVTGPQIADGYLNDAEKTAAAFVTPPGSATIHYRTGDLAYRDGQGQVHFVNRIDNQVKIRGYRVEIGEIEAQLRAASGGHAAIVVPLPLKSPTPVALTAAIEAWEGDPGSLLKAIASSLPDYMIPSRIESIPQFPRNASGKVDRGAIGQMIIERLDHQPAKAKESAARTGGRRGEKRRQALIRMVQAINPALGANQILGAPNLMEAGLDSIGFVNFTAELEQKYGLEFDQASANELAHLSLKQIARQITINRKTGGRKEARRRRRRESSSAATPLPGLSGRRERKRRRRNGRQAAPESAAATTVLPPPPQISRRVSNRPVHARAMRSLSFVDNFPSWAAVADRPVALFAGSSGFQASISVQDADERAAEMGMSVLAVNAGIAALSAEGLAQLSEFIRDTMRAQGKRIAFAVCELDPMHLSVLPPSGDLELIADYVAGRFVPEDRPRESRPGLWTASNRGSQLSTDPAEEAQAEPNWMRRRLTEIRNTFLGHVDMNNQAVAAWIRGVSALASISDYTCAVIHPLLDPNLEQDRAASGGHKLTDLLARLSGATGIDIFDDRSFSLAPEGFKDKNHLNSRGRGTFTRQIVDLVFASNRAGQAMRRA